MAVGYNPRIVTDGLVLALDAGNSKGYDKYENLITYSEKIGATPFATYGWANQNSIAVQVDTADVSDPLGGNTASKLTNGSTNPFSQTLKRSSLSATVYTASVYLRTLSGTETASINVFLQASPYTTIANSGEVTVTSEWQRFDVTTSTATSADYNLGIQVRSGTIYAWGAQVERGTTVTDYYKTTDTIKTRGTTWTDLSGNGNNGTLLSEGGLIISQYNNNNGGCLDFDGANDYIDTGTSFLKTNDNVTLEAFFNHVSNSNDQFFLYEGEGDGFGGNVEFHLYVAGGYLASWFTTSSGDFALGGSGVSASAITAGEWNHAAVTYSNLSTASGASSKLYLNGVEIDSGSGATVNIASMPTSNLLIGKPYSTSLGRRYNGQIAAVKVYNRTLSASEVKQNFNALRGRFGI